MQIDWQNKGFRHAKFEYWSILLAYVYVCKPPMDVAYVLDKERFLFIAVRSVTPTSHSSN